MTTNYRIRYKIVDEDGQAVLGRVLVEEDVRQYAELLNKRFRDAQSIWLELEETVEVPNQLTDEEREMLEDLD